MEGYLKVTPEQLMKTAGEFSTAGEQIRSLTAEMMNIVNGLKAVWQGEAAESYSAKFTGLSDDIERMNRMIREHVSDLNEMAANYRTAEEASTESSAALLQDVIL